jgi:hypothetical protein
MKSYGTPQPQTRLCFESVAIICFAITVKIIESTSVIKGHFSLNLRAGIAQLV